jgi:hypothetical protein
MTSTAPQEPILDVVIQVPLSHYTHQIYTKVNGGIHASYKREKETLTIKFEAFPEIAFTTIMSIVINNASIVNSAGKLKATFNKESDLEPLLGAGWYKRQFFFGGKLDGTIIVYPGSTLLTYSPSKESLTFKCDLGCVNSVKYYQWGRIERESINSL